MSFVSKTSSRSSSSSGFSSTIQPPFTPTSTLQTVLEIQRVDVNARAIFCGEQDCRLNELRCMTGAIIDLNLLPDAKYPFEKVNWKISHPDKEVRHFVVRRLQYWMQQTQILCDMAYADAIFLQEQDENQMRPKPPPPPLTAANFGRRNRTQSLTQSITPNIYSTPTTPVTSSNKYEKPFTGLLGRTLSRVDFKFQNHAKLFQSNTDIRQSEETVSNYTAMTSTEINELLETAKQSGVLSDTSENELDQNRVCFADTVSLSKLAEMLKNNELKPTSSMIDIDNVIQQCRMNIKSRDQIRQMNNKKYWFHRVILDDHIQFPVGISHDANEARCLAYRRMIDVCLNKNGVKMKMLKGNRVKVVKGPISEGQNPDNNDDRDINATYISTNDLSCLSNCNVVY